MVINHYHVCAKYRLKLKFRLIFQGMPEAHKYSSASPVQMHSNYTSYLKLKIIYMELNPRNKSPESVINFSILLPQYAVMAGTIFPL